MIIKLYNSNAEINRVDKSADLKNEMVLNGTLRDQTDILNPTVLIEHDTLITSNYAYIPDFNRYYFINDIMVNTNNTYILTLSVDVLMTYKTEIGSLYAIIGRNETEYNPTLIDSLVPAGLKDDVTIYKATNTLFDVDLNISQKNIVLTAYA